MKRAVAASREIHRSSCARRIRPRFTLGSAVANSTAAAILDDEQFARLLDESRTALKPFMTGGEAIQFDMPSLIVTVRKH